MPWPEDFDIRNSRGNRLGFEATRYAIGFEKWCMSDYRQMC